MRKAHLTLFALVLSLSAAAPADGDGFVSIFNGRDLEGWTPKFKGEEAGVNYKNTYRVEDGVLKVSYDQYTAFEGRFGHLYYKTPSSDYILRFEYRFTGEQCKGGPGWAFRNSGVMVHGEDPNAMAVDQDFPTSIEVQLLGGGGSGERTTGNLCTPGTHVEMNGKLETRHCTNSTSRTYHGDQWVKAEIIVRGNESITHIINGEKVLEYQKPQLDPGDKYAKKLIAAAGGNVQLSGGTFSLQAESHPCEFRNLEIKVVK